MSLGFSRFGYWLVLIWFAGNGLLVSHVRAQGKPQPRRSIELSETNTAEILTNLNQLSTKKDGFRQLDDRLKSLKGISNPNSMETRFSTPYASPTTTVLPTKTLKELLERQRNWGLTAEELGAAASPADSDGLSTYETDQKDSKKSSLEQFYDALNRSGPRRSDSDRLKDNFSALRKPSDPRDDNAMADDANLPPAIRDKVQRLKGLVSEDQGSILNAVRARPSFENFFGVTDNNAKFDQVSTPKASEESFMDRFKKGLESQPAGSKLDPALNALLPAETSRRPAFSPSLEPLPAFARHDPSEITPGNLNSVPSRTLLPDVNATLLNQWNPMYTPPKLELPKPTPGLSVPLNMEFPRRKF